MNRTPIDKDNYSDLIYTCLFLTIRTNRFDLLTFPKQTSAPAIVQHEGIFMHVDYTIADNASG